MLGEVFEELQLTQKKAKFWLYLYMFGKELVNSFEYIFLKTSEYIFNQKHCENQNRWLLAIMQYKNCCCKRRALFSLYSQPRNITRNV